MSDDRLKLPPYRDARFYQRRKHDAYREVPPPQPPLECAVADSHAHVHLLPDPALELARCAAVGVGFVCEICDPSEDALDVRSALAAWRAGAEGVLREWGRPELEGALPEMRAAVGVHPHNARLYDDAVEARLVALLRAPQVGALGEIGLDFHYDLSPRETQRAVFRRQLRLARELGLPVALHLRGGDGGGAEDDAHAQALEILQDEGFPAHRTLLHCCALPPAALRPWLEFGCFVAFGGAVTFKRADDAREGMRLVPADRLLLETDAPYMTPEPMRGTACTPAHVVFTAEAVARERGCAPGQARRELLARTAAATRAFYGAA